MEICNVKLNGITDSKTVILFREHLNQSSKHKDFDEISINDFMYSEDAKLNSFRIPCQLELIIFIDIKGRTKILKNRWGATGNVN